MKKAGAARSMLLAALVVGVLASAACRGPLRKVEDVRDDLALGMRDALVDLPACDQGPLPNDWGCLESVARALGSRSGFASKPPDQVAMATVAVRIARDSRGAAVGDGPTWLSAMASASGPGADALRLAVATRLAASADDFVGSLQRDGGDGSNGSDGRARRLLGDIAAAVPGACGIYATLGSGVNADALPPAERPDRAACVRADLLRAGAPGESYGLASNGVGGDGTLRAAEGALALARDAARALHQGSTKTDARVRGAFDTALSRTDAALARCALPRSL